MSSQATGAVVILPGAVILLAGAAVVGTGILIGKGAAKSIMWCHDKMEENYRSACQTFADLKAQAEAEVRSRSSEREGALSAYMEHYSGGLNLVAPTGETTAQDQMVDQRILDALQQAREALSAQHSTPLDYQTEVERRKLAAAIRAYRGVVAPDAIAAAEAALGGTLETLTVARKTLEETALAIVDTTARQQRIANELDVTLDDASRELSAARTLATQRDTLTESDVSRFEEVTKLINAALEVRDRGNAEEALGAARRALDAARDELYRATAAVAREWDGQHRQYARVAGQLDALANLVSDLEAGRLAPAQRVASFRDQIAKLRNNVAHAQETRANPGEALPAIEANLERLKDEAFAQADDGEQHVIGDQIAETLRELGFESAEAENEPPTADTLAGRTRIAARRVEQNPDGASEEHLVYFSVDPKGRVSYDFSGYDRDECVREAERVFRALRKRGILLMDAAKLAALDPQRATADVLQSDEMLPAASMNKRQPHIHQAILDVLTREMGFTHVDQIITGGTIELDAHNGQGHSYHAEVSSDGGTLVIRNGLDVSEDMSDRVVAAASAVQVVDPPYEQEPESVSAYTYGLTRQSAGQSE